MWWASCRRQADKMGRGACRCTLYGSRKQMRSHSSEFDAAATRRWAGALYMSGSASSLLFCSFSCHIFFLLLVELVLRAVSRRRPTLVSLLSYLVPSLLFMPLSVRRL